MITTTKSDFSLEQTVSIIENAFHEADAKDRFENNCVSAVKPERGQIIIQPKNSFCYDPIAVNEALLKKFSPERYTLTVTCFMVMISKKILR